MHKLKFLAAGCAAVLLAAPALAQAPTGRVTPQYPERGSPAARGMVPINPSNAGDSYDGPLSKRSGRPPVGSEGTTSGSTAPPGVVRPPAMQTPPLR